MEMSLSIVKDSNKGPRKTQKGSRVQAAFVLFVVNSYRKTTLSYISRIERVTLIE